MPLALLCDEHIPYQIVEGLRRRGVDVVTVQEADLRAAEDDVLLEVAHQQGRVLYTNDTDFLRLHAVGIPHAGIFYHHSLTHSLGEAIRVVALACEVLSANETRNRLEFL
jgi:uncharacterized protein with PIN domain